MRGIGRELVLLCFFWYCLLDIRMVICFRDILEEGFVFVLLSILLVFEFELIEVFMTVVNVLFLKLCNFKLKLFFDIFIIFEIK